VDAPRPLSPAERVSAAEALRAHAPFERMEEGHLAFMVERLALADWPAGGPVLDPQGGPPAWLYVVARGTVVAEAPHPYAGEGGARAQLVEGESFPLGALLTARPVLNNYRALAETRCYLLPAEDFRTLLELSAVFQDFCTRRLAHLLEQSQHQVQAQYARRALGQQSLATPLAELIPRPTVTCGPERPLREALAQMDREGIGSMVVTDPDGAPLGIFTLRDLLRVSARATDLDAPIARFMSRELITLPAEAAAQDAVLAMVGRRIRHVLVVRAGRVVGLVSERDLFGLRQTGIHEVGEAIDRARDCAEVQAGSQGIRRLARVLLGEGVAAEPLMRLVSTLNDRLTARIIELAGTAGGGFPGLRWCWLALGSEGRFEQTLATDQDNGIIFEPPPGADPEVVRARLLPSAEQINRELDRCGFPLCRGQIMASNPRWCLSLAEWQGRFADWIERGDAQALLHAAIFFDFRPVSGDASLAEALRSWLNRAVARRPRFLQQMAANALENRPPLGFVRDFVVATRGEHPRTVNLKLNGAAPFVDAARVYALAAGSAETNTLERLRAAAAHARFSIEQVEAWGQAFAFIQLLRLRRQHLEPEAPPDAGNHLDPDRLNELDRRILKESFRQARKLQTKLALDYNLYGRV
jgi:CBS domain-containing protein